MGFLNKILGNRGASNKWLINKPSKPRLPSSLDQNQVVKSSPLSSNEQLLDDIKNKLYADQMALKGSNYPVYLGENNTPISPLTQRARMLREESQNKPLPYSKKVGTFLNKEATGFSPEQANSLMNMVKRGDISQKSALERLQKQFGRNYGYEVERENRLKNKITKDETRLGESTRSNFNRLNDEFKELENSRNIDVAKAFHKSGEQKNIRRNALINQLEEFGNQEHAIGNLINKGKRDSFDEQVELPNRKINSAYRAISNLGPEEDHPSRTIIRNRELQRIQNAYSMPTASYPGERVVGIQPETQLSFNNAQALSPKYRDKYHGERKAIEKNITGNTLPNKIFQTIPGAVDPLMKNLDFLTTQQLKKQSKEIAGKHVRLGSFGSGSHKAESEKAMRELLRKVYQEREGVMTGSTKAETNLAMKREQTALAKHRMMDMLGSEEYGNLLNNNSNLNKLGWEKRANKQADENTALKAWYNQLQHSIGETDGESYNNLAKEYNTDLVSLFNKPQTYNENARAFENQKSSIRNQLDITSRKQLEDFEKAQKYALMNGGTNNFRPMQSNLKGQAYALAKASPLY